MRRLTARQDKAMDLTARLAVALAIKPEAPAAAIQAQVAVAPGPCRKQKPEKIRTSFSRQWTGPGSRRAAMEMLAVVAEVAGVAALPARRALGSRKLAAVFRGSKQRDAGMTRAIEVIAVGEVTERSAARAAISRIP